MIQMIVEISTSRWKNEKHTLHDKLVMITIPIKMKLAGIHTGIHFSICSVSIKPPFSHLINYNKTWKERGTTVSKHVNNSFSGLFSQNGHFLMTLDLSINNIKVTRLVLLFNIAGIYDFDIPNWHQPDLPKMGICQKNICDLGLWL